MQARSHLFIIVLLLLLPVLGQSQVKKGTWLVDLGIGIGAYGSSTNLNFDSGVNAAPAIARIAVDYGIMDQFALGLQYRRLDYLTDDDSTASFINANTNAVLFNGTYHLVNKSKFNFYVGTSFGYATIYYERQNVDGAYGFINGKGIPYGLNTGVRKYFGANGTVGFFFHANLINYPFEVTNIEVDGQVVESVQGIPTDQLHVNFAGVDLIFGVALKF